MRSALYTFRVTIFSGLLAVLAGCIGVTALSSAMIVPETRLARSQFDVFRSEEGAPMFRYRVSHFTANNTEAQRANAQRWLQEWLTEFGYCKAGYDITSNTYQPFPRAGLGLDPISVGGTVVAIGRCKPLEPKPA